MHPGLGGDLNLGLPEGQLPSIPLPQLSSDKSALETGLLQLFSFWRMVCCKQLYMQDFVVYEETREIYIHGEGTLPLFQLSISFLISCFGKMTFVLCFTTAKLKVD